jgi:large subunit ribosomal protein L35
MTKQKTKKAVVKRMKLTKSGKVKRSHAFTSHILATPQGHAVRRQVRSQHA